MTLIFILTIRNAIPQNPQEESGKYKQPNQWATVFAVKALKNQLKDGLVRTGAILLKQLPLVATS